MKLLCFLLLTFSIVSVFGQDDNFELVWSDEFDGEGPLDGTKWFHQTQLPNGNSWYNGEIQHYTNRTDNSYMSDGTLKIVAKSENFTDQGVTKTHTSARLNSKFAFTYGYVSIRAKMPLGVGTWPALWTLGQNIIEPGGFWSSSMGTVSWPACGELDIIEHWGNNQNFVQSAIHTPSSFGDTQNKGGQVVPTTSSEFHIYTMEWSPERIIFSVDDVEHYTYEPSTQNSSTWPFDANQYLLLNVAVLPDISSNFTESAMEVDYVRVYQDTTLSIEDLNASDDVLVLSNPVAELLSLEVPANLIGAQVSIYNLLGQEVFLTDIQEVDTKINMSQYKSGLYILKIRQGDTVVTKKILKK